MSKKTTLQKTAHSFFLFSVLIFLSACSKYPVFDGDYTRIDVAPGPEDIALDTINGSERLIISCSERRTTDYSRNGFYVYSISDGELRKLELEGLPTDIQLRPHGIDIAFVNDVKTLYCVNHEKNAEEFPPAGRQSILVFELQDDKVIFREQLTSPLMVSPNDVCTDHKGGIFVSIDSGKINSKAEKIFSLPRSYVLHYDGNNWTQVGDKLRYANGVGVKDGRIYMTGTQEKNIISYAVNSDGTFTDKKEMPCLKGNDNITFVGNKLVTTAHHDFLKFIGHVKDANKPSPCSVYTVDLQTGAIDTLYTDGGTVLSAASTGLIYNGELFVAQVFNPYLIRIPLGQ
ncbi:MAG: hypothetical protein EP314_08235 [Bacteroidetes bacterium]|nr:MAG: hypothetical protein EP314_08235 [Bacteroidota bacterium]